MSTISWPLNGNTSGYSGGGFKGVTNSQRGLVNIRSALGQVVKTAGGRGMGGIDIVVEGDSIDECNLPGTGVNQAYTSGGAIDYLTSRWSDYLKVRLQKALNPAGVPGGYGYVPIFTGAAYTGVPASGFVMPNFGTTSTGPGAGTGNKNRIFAAGGNGFSLILDPVTYPVEFRQNATDVDIVGTINTTGSVRYDFLAGGTPGAAMIGTGTVTGTAALGTGTTAFGGRLHVGPFTRTTAATTFQFAAPTANTWFADGIILYDGDYNCGVRLHNVAKWGSVVANFCDAANGGSAASLEANFTRFGSGTPGSLTGANQAKLFIFDWITNDVGTGASPTTAVGTFITRYAQQVDAALALTSKPSVLLLIPPCQSSANALANYPAFVSAIYAMASTRPDVTILDLWAYCNNTAYSGYVTTYGWNGDGIHYSDIAQRDWAEMIFNLIMT